MSCVLPHSYCDMISELSGHFVVIGGGATLLLFSFKLYYHC